jgi:hypothetical protein
VIVPDYKTTSSPSPAPSPSTIANYGYHQQGAWYLDAVTPWPRRARRVRVRLPGEDPALPRDRRRAGPDRAAVGALLNDRALEVYAECTATDTWPGYTTTSNSRRYPPWASATWR